jgi:OOP family OmpA-OmpF porin
MILSSSRPDELIRQGLESIQVLSDTAQKYGRPCPYLTLPADCANRAGGELKVNHCRTTIAVALILLLATLSANAQERTGFAVHGGIGASQIKDRDGSETFQGNGFGYFFGIEYRFVPRFALGLDAFDLGSASDTVGSVDTEIEARGIDLFARLVFPLNDAVEVYGRVGRVVYQSAVSPGFGGNPFGEDGVSLGAGVDIGRDQLSFRLEGRYFDGAHDESGALLTAGLSYRF